MVVDVLHWACKAHVWQSTLEQCIIMQITLCAMQEAPEVVADVLHVKSAADAGRDIGRGIAGMRQTHRGPVLLVVQVLLVIFSSTSRMFNCKHSIKWGTTVPLKYDVWARPLGTTSPCELCTHCYTLYTRAP